MFCVCFLVTMATSLVVCMTTLDNTRNLPLIMESLKRALSPLQWSLSLSGCILFPSRSIVVNILVAVHGICLVLIYGSYLVLLAQKLNVAVTVMDVVDYIWNCEFVIFSTSSIVLFWYRRKKLMQLFQALSCLLTQNDLRNLRRISLSLLIFRIVVTITTRYQLWGITTYSSSKFQISLTEMFLKYILIHHWDIMGMAIFMITITTIHFAERNSMIQMTTSIPGPRVVYREVCKWISIKDEAIVCIAPFPFMSFFHYFMYGVCSISYYHTVRFDLNSPSIEVFKSSLSLTRIIVSFIQMYVWLSVTSHLCKHSKDNLNALQSAIFERSTKEPNKWLMVLDKIKEGKNYEYNAFGMFTMNKSLLLPFVASFTTFTALFVQLINQSKT